jgi:hypothetical protein
MSTVVKILRETETEASEEALREVLRKAVRALARKAALRQEPVSVDALPSEVRMVGRSSRSARPIRSVKSTIVPEPGQIRSERRRDPRLAVEPPGQRG